MTRAEAYQLLQNQTYISIKELSELEQCSISLANKHANKIRTYVKERGKILPRGKVPVSLYLKLIATTSLKELHQAFLMSVESGLVKTGSREPITIEGRSIYE